MGNDHSDPVETCYTPLYRFAFSLAGNHADAADLTQQTFFIWAQKKEALRDPSKVKSWLFTTLYREYLRSNKRAKRFRSDESAWIETESQTVEPEGAKKTDASTLFDILLDIDDIYRVPLVLYYLEDLSYKEIATMLDLPIGTVMSRLSRGKEHLRKRLKNAPDAEDARDLNQFNIS